MRQTQYNYDPTKPLKTKKRRNSAPGRRHPSVGVMSNLRYIVIIVIVCAVAGNYIWSCIHKDNRDNQPELTQSLTESQLADVIIPRDVDSKIINYTGFTVSFNTQMHQPNYVSWELTGAETEGTQPRGSNFAPDNTVEGCATLDDYRRSGFDRGHMAPSADMKWSPQAMNDCFYLTNICPQDGKLNKGTWNKLENKCREWAKRDSAIIIVCGPVLTDRLTQTIGDSQIPVPKRFFKVVLAPYANPPRAIGFILNNGYVEGGMQKAAVSVDEVEAVTGFDFFHNLPDDVENSVEASQSFNVWFRP